MVNDESIQLVNYNKKEKSYTFNEKTFQRIIKENEVEDLPVVVISVAGLFRKGKSFLLNFFLRYLYAEDRENWLDESSESLKGFEWRGGRVRTTEGIHVWSRIFKLPTSNGGQAAVMLMDTQGTFDGKSSSKTGTTIFALSALVSSVQVYNLSQQINENDLENLLWFTEYASFVQEDSKQKPFQSLIFLVRDWQFFEECPYGEEGGKNLLDDVLEITPDQEPTLAKVRKNIKSTFEKLSCFLLPHPGKTVATSKSFSGRIDDIDAEFITQMRNFIPSVLCEDSLVVKNINGLDLTCREFVELFATYLKHYNSDELPDEVSKAEAAAEAYNAPLLERCVGGYKTEMLKALDDSPCQIESCTSELFSDLHKSVQETALNQFHEAKRFSTNTDLRKRMKTRIEELFVLLEDKRSQMYRSTAAEYYDSLVNEIVKEYNSKMLKILEKNDDAIEHFTPATFAGTQVKNKAIAINKFKKGARFSEYVATKHFDKMIQEINESCGINERRRKVKFESAATTYYNRHLEGCLCDYNKKMRALVEGNDHQLEKKDFVRKHKKHQKAAVKCYNEAECYCKDIQFEHLEKLRGFIEDAFVAYMHMFDRQRIRHLETELEMEEARLADEAANENKEEAAESSETSENSGSMKVAGEIIKIVAKGVVSGIVSGVADVLTGVSEVAEGLEGMDIAM